MSLKRRCFLLNGRGVLVWVVVLFCWVFLFVCFVLGFVFVRLFALFCFFFIVQNGLGVCFLLLLPFKC